MKHLISRNAQMLCQFRFGFNFLLYNTAGEMCLSMAFYSVEVQYCHETTQRAQATVQR